MPRIPTTVSSLPNGVIRRDQARGQAPSLQQSEDRQFNEAQRELAKVMAPAKAHPHAGGLVVLKDVVFTATVTKDLAHGLGRAFVGWQALRVRSGYARFQEVANSPTSLDAKQVRIVSDATVTADVWVW